MQLIKGKRSVMEALLASVRVDRIVVRHSDAGKKELLEVLEMAALQGIRIQHISPQDFDRIPRIDDSPHQGIVAYISDIHFSPLTLVTDNPTGFPLVAVVDHVEDPFNFGAVLRTCELLGFKAVVFPKDRNSQLSAGVIKASSGAVYHLNLIRVANVAQAVTSLQRAGYWVYGSSVEDGVSLKEVKPLYPLALIIGNEGKGISNRLLSLADFKLTIPTSGKVSSFNVSVATGILAYTLSQGFEASAE